MSNTASHLLLESGLHFINVFESQLTSGSSYLHAAVEGRGRDPYHSERPDHYSNFPFKPVSITRDQKKLRHVASASHFSTMYEERN